MFSKAIVKTPCRNLVKGITSSHLGLPDYELALLQHSDYIRALKRCGLDVTILEADEKYPDSTFVEDTALLTPACAIITNPGAPPRKGEITSIKNIIKDFYSNIEFVSPPGTIEAGDIMMVGNHFFIGISDRTNDEGADQMIYFLNKYDMAGSKISLQDVLHLKSGTSYIENNNMLATKAFLRKPEFQKFNLIPVDDDEIYAANSLWINGNVLVPEGFPKTKNKIEQFGYNTISLDMSEFRKLDGGLSCLSLRF